MTAPAPARRWARFGLRLAVSAAALAVLFAIIPLDEVLDALRRLAPLTAVLALTTYLALHLIGVAKWRLLMNTAGAGISYGASARCYYYGLFGNTFLPSIVGGDLVRAGLAIRLAASKSGVLLGSFVDRVLDVIGLALLAGIGGLLVPTALPPASRSVFVGVALTLAVLVGGMGAVALALPARRFPFKLRRKLVRVREAFRAIGRRPGAIVYALLLGMLLQGLLVVLNWRLGAAIGFDIPLVVWLFVWPLAKVAALAPLTQGGIGVREAAQVALFQPFGVAAHAALATGLLFQAVLLSGSLVSGLIALVLGARHRPMVAA